jgi:hypothetical protein
VGIVDLGIVLGIHTLSPSPDYRPHNILLGRGYSAVDFFQGPPHGCHCRELAALQVEEMTFDVMAQVLTGIEDDLAEPPRSVWPNGVERPKRRGRRVGHR